ncbi:MAG: amino acid ABC transporter permease [Pirellulales bacterium]|nr:amino acid ABC transporter permease [Pirellulales bacterium]
MSAEYAPDRNRRPKGHFLNNPKVRNLLYQAILAAVLIWIGYTLFDNTKANLENRGIVSGFDFMRDPAGFGITQALIAYDESMRYSRAFFVGLLNTFLVGAVGIFFATILGFLIGIGRLSPNWIVSRACSVYIEIVRNLPLLLQIFIWYFGVLRLLPAKRDSLDLGVFGFLNVAGWFAPMAVLEDGIWTILAALVLGICAAIALSIQARRRQAQSGKQFPVFWAASGLIVGLPALASLMSGMPIGLDAPELGRFGPRGGTQIASEFFGLLIALITYTAAFIAEIVRAGILAVNKGQVEAAHALGFRQAPTLRLVVIPQAMRVIIPPLTSEYLNLVKNSSLAVAIGFPDVVSVGGTILNQTGQAVEIISLWMLVYLTISLLTSALMNYYNLRTTRRGGRP